MIAHRRTLLSFLTGLVFSVVACQGGERRCDTTSFTEANDECNDPVSPLTLTPEATSVIPYQALVIKVRPVSLTEEQYQGTLGSASISLRRLTDSTAVLVVPDLPEDDYSLTVTVGQQTGTTSLAMGGGVAISDPAAVLENQLDGFDFQLNALSELAESPADVPPAARDALRADVATIGDMVADARAAIDGASETDRLALAGFVIANPAFRGELPASNVRASTAQNLEQCIAQWKGRVIFAAAIASAALVLVLASFATGGLTVVPTVLLLAVAMLDLHVTILSGTEDCRVVESGPTLGGNEAGSMEPRGAALAAGVVFEDGVAQSFQVSATFRPLQSSDIGNIPGAEDLSATLEHSADVFAAGNALLPTPLQSKPYRLTQVSSAVSTVETVTPAYLSIVNVQPSTVSVTSGPDGSRLKLTATAENLQADISFTFDLVYDDQAGTTRTSPVAATLRAKKPSYTLAGADGPTSSFGVDDDYSIFLNGVPLRVNDDGQATSEPPLSFQAQPGDVLRIEARDVFGDFLCYGFNPLWLYGPFTDGQPASQHLVLEVPHTCPMTPRSEPFTFVTQEFQIP